MLFRGDVVDGDALGQVRRAAAEWAAQAGLPGLRATDFVIAVSEITVNAIRYGSPAAQLELQVAGDVAQAEVRDSGHWLDCPRQSCHRPTSTH